MDFIETILQTEWLKSFKASVPKSQYLEMWDIVLTQDADTFEIRQVSDTLWELVACWETMTAKGLKPVTFYLETSDKNSVLSLAKLLQLPINQA